MEKYSGARLDQCRLCGSSRKGDLVEGDSGFADVNDTRLYYETAGSGLPLVLMHGFSRDTRMWDDQWQTLAQRYQVVRFDARGFGQSALPSAESFSPSEDLEALLDYLGIDQACLLGHSMGGPIAATFTLAYPETTRALILVGSGLPGFQPPPRLAADPRNQEYVEFWNSVYETARSSGVAAAKDVWRNSPVARPSLGRPGVAARLDEMLLGYSGWHWVNESPSRLPRRLREPQRPVAQRLDEITQPVLVIVGERELPGAHAVADYLERHVRSVRKIVLSGAGHYPMMEDPEAFNEAVLKFLASLG